MLFRSGLGISPDTRFVFDDHYRCGRVLHEHRDDPGQEPGARQGLDRGFRNILNLRVPLHGKLQRHRLDRHLMTPSLGGLGARPA